jgi:hypothetical protein
MRLRCPYEFDILVDHDEAVVGAHHIHEAGRVQGASLPRVSHHLPRRSTIILVDVRATLPQMIRRYATRSVIQSTLIPYLTRIC